MNEWRLVKLGDPEVASIILGQSPPSETYNTVGRGLPFFQGKADFGARFPRHRVWCSSPSKTARPGDILVSVRAPVGAVNLADSNCAIGRGIAAIRPVQVDGEFLFYVMMHAKPQLEAHGTGSTFASINRSVLEDFAIRLPDQVSEQRSAATLLRGLQQFVENQSVCAAQLVALKAATMAKVFREGLRGAPLKETEIRSVPENWEVLRLGAIAKVGNGSTPSRSNEAYWNPGVFPWITSTKVHEIFIREGSELVSETALRECHLPVVPSGSLVIAITGQGKTLGNVALLEIDTCVNQHLAYVRFQDDRAVPEFFLFWLQNLYDFFRQISAAGGSTKGALTCGFLSNLSVPLPRRDEQQEIARVLLDLTKRHRVAEEKARSASALFAAALHEIMTGAISIKDLDLAEVTHA